jgi:hypothetical protein
MPYSPNWSPADINQYKAIKRQAVSDGLDENVAQARAAKIINRRKSTPPAGSTSSPGVVRRRPPGTGMRQRLQVARLKTSSDR